tara:strand:- start:1085 stop:1846 length:762 start_codon:yes stop_codon:yes gene_type:complete
MTWFDRDFKQRKPITIDASAGDGSESVEDIEVDIPKQWDLFWDNIRSDMFDVVPVDLDGNGIAFARKAGANYATRTLTLQIDGYRVTTASMNQIYLYFQNASASDVSSGVTIASPLNGYIELSKAGGFLVKKNMTAPATQRPVVSFTKSVSDIVDVYFATTGLFRKMVSSYNGRNDFEGIKHISVQSLDSSGSNNASRYELDACRFIGGYIKVRVKAGSDGTDYALSVTITTSTGQSLDLRCLIQVRDQLPES